MGKLGVFGDSFAESSPHRIGTYEVFSWPFLVADNLGIDVQNFARSGTSVWYSCNRFLKNYKDFTHVVFVYTEQNRWPSLPENLLRFSSIYDEYKLAMFPTIDEIEYDTMKKLIGVHKYIFDEEFNHFVFQSVFDKVNEICRENKISLVNVFPFFDEKDAKNFNFDKMHGTCILGVDKVSTQEIYSLDDYSPKHKDLLFYVKNGDYRRNHLNNDNNKRLSEIVTSEMNTTLPHVLNVSTDSKFNYDVQLLLDYRQLIMQTVKENWK